MFVLYDSVSSFLLLPGRWKTCCGQTAVSSNSKWIHTYITRALDSPSPGPYTVPATFTPTDTWSYETNTHTSASAIKHSWSRAKARGRSRLSDESRRTSEESERRASKRKNCKTWADLTSVFLMVFSKWLYQKPKIENHIIPIYNVQLACIFFRTMKFNRWFNATKFTKCNIHTGRHKRIENISPVCVMIWQPAMICRLPVAMVRMDIDFIGAPIQFISIQTQVDNLLTYQWLIRRRVRVWFNIQIKSYYMTIG